MSVRLALALCMLVLLLTGCAAPVSTPAATVNPSPTATTASTATSAPATHTQSPSPTAVPPTETTTPIPPSPTATRTPTVAPSETPSPTRTATHPFPSPVPPTATQPPPPDFVAIALAVRAQVDNYAWQIDQSARRFAPWLAGSRYFGDLPLRGEEADINCIELTGAYDYVAARATLTLPTTMAGPYQLYADGVSLFLTNAEGVYLNCHQFMANPNVDVIIPHGEWQNARTQAGQARDMLTQAIIAAGGTP